MPSYVITGSARGIGLEFVRQLSTNPENTVFAIVRTKNNSQSLTDMKAKNVHIIEANITDFKALKAAAVEVGKVTGGSLDFLVNNAAFIEDLRVSYTLDGYPEGEEELLSKDLVDSFNVNVVGVVHTINVFLPLLKKGTAKKVITISSGMGDAKMVLIGEVSNAVPYSTSKAAVNMIVAKYAAQYKAEGFVFLALSPGLVNTATRAPTPEEVEGYKKMIVSFRKVYPNFDGAISPETSVNLMLRVIDKWTVKDTGAFVSHYGNKQWL